MRRALTEGGRYVFEISNPALRVWEQWTPVSSRERVVDGQPVQMSHDHQRVGAGLIRHVLTFESPQWTQQSISMVRFPDPALVTAMLDEAGLDVEQRFGDWSGSQLTAQSPDVVLITRRR